MNERVIIFEISERLLWLVKGAIKAFKGLWMFTARVMVAFIYDNFNTLAVDRHCSF